MKRLAAILQWLVDRLNPARSQAAFTLLHEELAKAVVTLRKQREELASVKKVCNEAWNTLLAQTDELQELRAERAVCVVPAAAPDWLPEHQLAHKTYLASPAGVTLMQRARFIHNFKLVEASQDVFHTSHSCGLALGMGQTIAWLTSLSRTTRAPVDSGTEKEVSTNAGPPGEAALRDSMSP